MASSSSSTVAIPTSSPSTSSEGPRLEAGPLPRKRGELGYQEDMHEQSAAENTHQTEEISLPARHPADRDNHPAQPQTAASESSSASPASPASDASSMRKTKRILAFFKPKKAFRGVTLRTLAAFLIQLCIVGGTIAAWVICVRYVVNPMDQQMGNSGGMSATSSAIFIHIVFGVAVLGQLLFLERRIYRIRAERYAFLHPGEMLPTSSRRSNLDQSIAISPWNRPPLPTYAAALAQSGVGTGDVEDNMIAVIPPPAYGNTRGSRLLLSGYLNNTQRLQRPTSAASAASHMSQVGDRPVSYMSRDEEWEIIQDADRAMQLEHTLASLERPVSRT